MMIKKLLFLLLLFSLINNANADWCDYNYEYYVPVLINHSESISDYSVLLNISYDSNMNADFSDINFYSSSCARLPYYVQYVEESDYALIWVKTDVVDGIKVISMYYGDEDAVSYSDFNSAFLYSDDFNDDTLRDEYNVSKVEGNCSFIEYDGKLNYTSENYGSLQEPENNCYDFLVMNYFEENITIELSFDWVVNTSQELFCNDTGCDSGESNLGGTLRNRYYGDGANNEYSDLRVYNYDYLSDDETYEFNETSTIIVQRNATPHTTVTYTSGVEGYEGLGGANNSFTRRCVIVRQYSDLSVEVYFADTCDNTTLTSSDGVLDHYSGYYHVLQMRGSNYYPDYWSATFDNLRLRKYVGGQSEDYYTSSEPQATFGDVQVSTYSELFGFDMVGTAGTFTNVMFIIVPILMVLSIIIVFRESFSGLIPKLPKL